MPAAPEATVRQVLSHPVSDPTPRWHWRKRDVWGFRRRKSPTIPSDPAALLADVESRAAAAVPQPAAGASVALPPVTAVTEGTSISDSDLVELAIQTWRLQTRIDGLDENEHGRLRKQLSDSARRFLKILERFDVAYEDPSGKPYTDGWKAVEVVAWDPYSGQPRRVPSGPWVHDVIAPIVRRNEAVIKCGQVVCVDPEDE